MGPVDLRVGRGHDTFTLRRWLHGCDSGKKSMSFSRHADEMQMKREFTRHGLDSALYPVLRGPLTP